MSDRMRDTRQRHIKEEIEGVFVCCRQAPLERFIDQCVLERVVETLGERPKEKNECARWIECRGRGGRGGRVHEREKVSGSYKG